MDIKNSKTFNKAKDINTNLFSVLIIVLSIFLVVLIISTVVGIQNKIKEGEYIGQEIETKNTISVSESSEVYAKPDLALANFSVKNEAATVAEAMKENAEKMNTVIAFIKEEGVEAKDLKTTNFNIYPRYEYRDVEVEIYPYNGERRVLVGYEITQTLSVKIRDMEKIGDIVQGATNKGANQVNNLQFTIEDRDEFEKQARNEAIEKAKNKAKELASELGVDLVRITNFSESNGAVYRDYDYYAKTEAVGMSGEVPQIETGENKIEVGVSITYEIR
jgi:uncharacterized protein